MLIVLLKDIPVLKMFFYGCSGSPTEMGDSGTENVQCRSCSTELYSEPQ